MKNLLFITAFLWISLQLTAQTTKGSLYVLIVGVSQYASSSDNLMYPAKDAAELYKLFARQTSADKIKLLLNRSATRDNVLKAATDLFTATNENDIVVFYFSGHGGKGVFFAHDKALAYDDLKKIFKKTRAHRKIIFADSCLSGDLRTESTNNNTSSTNMGNQNVCLFLSSRSTQYSQENSQLKNGTFTYFLIAGLKGGADADRNKIITARELFNFVNPKVKERTRGEQVPVMWGKFEDNMEIVNWNKTQ